MFMDDIIKNVYNLQLLDSKILISICMTDVKTHFKALHIARKH